MSARIKTVHLITSRDDVLTPELAQEWVDEQMIVTIEDASMPGTGRLDLVLHTDVWSGDLIALHAALSRSLDDFLDERC